MECLGKLPDALKFSSEVDLGKAVKQCYRFDGYECFEEVVFDSTKTCDLVFRKGDEVVCVEMKMELNFKVLAQAARWYSLATSVYVAVPYHSITPDKRTALGFMGIGVIGAYKEVSFGELMYKTSVVLDPDQLVPSDDWGSVLQPEHAHDAEAGCKNGKRSTPFSRTVEAVQAYCREHPDATLNECLMNIKTHYSNVKSAYGSLHKYAKTGIIEKCWKDPR